MAKRSLILTSTSNQGKKLQKTFTDVNPAATSESMLTAVQMINDLTTATYVQTDCVDKFNLDTEVAPSKTEPTLTLAANCAEKFNLSWFNSGYASAIRGVVLTYNGDGQLYAYTTQRGAVAGIANNMPNGSETGDILIMRMGWEESDDKQTFTEPFTVIVGATEGENYAAKTIEFVVE